MPAADGYKSLEAYRGCIEIQRILLRDIRTDKTSPTERARLAHAYCNLEETKRRLAMRPLPLAIAIRPINAIPHEATFIERPPRLLSQADAEDEPEQNGTSNGAHDQQE